MLIGLAATALATGACLTQGGTGARAESAGAPNGAVNPKGNAESTVNASGTAMIVPPSDLEAGANSFTEAQVRARIEGAGLVGVSGLHQDDRGIWHGHATRDGMPVDVGFDFKGNIAAE